MYKEENMNFCKNCGNQLSANSGFCQNCGHQVSQVTINHHYSNSTFSDYSKFTGGLFELIVIKIGHFFLILITLGLAIPWCVCHKQRWIASNTIIDGKRLIFTGKAMMLFGKYIVWCLLGIITFGIYFFWMGIKIKKWKVKYTHFDLS